MQQNISAVALAYRAAELLPEPPAAHDAFGYLAWEELVLSAATRIGEGFGKDPSPRCRYDSDCSPALSITGPVLISLANMLPTYPRLASDQVAAVANRWAAHLEQQRRFPVEARRAPQR